MLVTGRMSQVTTAEVLGSMSRIGAAPADDPLRQLAAESERVFGARAGIVTFQDQEVLHVPAAIPLTGGAGYLRVPVEGARGSHGLLQLWRDQPFSNNDARLAWILARGAAMAADARAADARAVASGRDDSVGAAGRDEPPGRSGAGMTLGVSTRVDRWA
jgi:hypothetical protein